MCRTKPKAAQKAEAVTTNQYKAGTVSYLNVIVTQTITLTNQITAVNILGRRMVASVLLLKALGGGWNASTRISADHLTGRNHKYSLPTEIQDVSTRGGHRRLCRADPGKASAQIG